MVLRSFYYSDDLFLNFSDGLGSLALVVVGAVVFRNFRKFSGIVSLFVTGGGV